MRNIIMGFSRPSKFKPGSYLIRLWMGWTPYSHVYLKIYSNYTDQDLVYQASHGSVHMIEYGNFLNQNLAIEEYSLDIEDYYLKSSVKSLQKLLQTPYGRIGLLKIVLNKLTFKLCGNKYFKGDGDLTFHCSELITKIFPKISTDLNIEPDFIEPIHCHKYLEMNNG